jgi:hypothetical protein
MQLNFMQVIQLTMAIMMHWLVNWVHFTQWHGINLASEKQDGGRSKSTRRSETNCIARLACQPQKS